MLNSTIGQKDLEESYNNLFSFEMIINVEVLKWEDQCPRLIQILVMLIMDIKQNLSLINILRSLYEVLSNPGADESLHLLIALLNSSFKDGLR